MSLKEILDLTWVPILAFVMSGVAGVHMLLLKKRPPYLKTKDDNRMLRDEEKYAIEGGKLLIFFSVGAAVMTGLLFVNIYSALAEMVVVFLVFSVRWRKVHDDFGPI